jgi:PAS domain S-box-containing protein
MEKYLKQVLQHSDSLLVLVDPSGKLEYMSPAMESLLGKAQVELVGKNWVDVSRNNEDDKAYIRKRIERFVASDEIKMNAYETKLDKACEENEWVLWSTVKTDDGKLLAWGQNISAQKRLEAELRSNNLKVQEVINDTTDSIQYAARLQNAILKPIESLAHEVSDAFILYAPKDIVSGDIYWYHSNEEYLYAAVLDCTGHGVPGAMLSLIANTLLKDIVVRQGISDPGEILQKFDADFCNYWQDSHSGIDICDGLDIALIRWNKFERYLDFSAAYRPLILIKDSGELIELKGSKYPIGHFMDIKKEFCSQRLFLDAGDWIYLFSDGYIDQFGGPREVPHGKKFNRSRFKGLLKDMNDLNGNDKQAYLEYAFNGWKQDREQLDDVTVMGISF